MSVHFYSLNQIIKEPIPVKIRIEKINPYSILYEGTKYLKVEGQTVNFVKFTVNEQGTVTEINNSTTSAVGLTHRENGAFSNNQKDPG